MGFWMRFGEDLGCLDEKNGINFVGRMEIRKFWRIFIYLF